MSIPGRVVIVRSACIAALAASAALTADRFHPDRGFCPLAAACERARASALGTLLGIPTSVLGILAFASLFFVTLLAPRVARRIGRPAALAGAAAGLVFLLYQALVLRSFCPLCLVADLSALVAGAAAFGWPPAPLRRGSKKTPAGGERVVTRLRWALVAQLAVAVPLFWPHGAARPSWVPLPQAVAFDAQAAPPPRADRTRARSGGPTSGDVASTYAAPRFAPMPSWPVAPLPTPHPTPLPPREEARVPVPPPPAPVAPALPTPSPEVAPPPVAAPPPAPSARAEEPPAPALRGFAIVEYLNPFCAHCRATHARLERVLASVDVPVQRHRVYVWATREAPPWARACACAQAQGREDALFQELLQTSDQDMKSVLGAARRAGLDVPTLRACMGSDAPDARLEWDHQRVERSQIEGLPTLDIGRRRLMGEQSEAELREAIRAALAEPP